MSVKKPANPNGNPSDIQFLKKVLRHGLATMTASTVPHVQKKIAHLRERSLYSIYICEMHFGQ